MCLTVSSVEFVCWFFFIYIYTIYQFDKIIVEIMENLRNRIQNSDKSYLCTMFMV